MSDIGAWVKRLFSKGGMIALAAAVMALGAIMAASGGSESSADRFREREQKRLEELITGLDGVDGARVMISLESESVQTSSGFGFGSGAAESPAVKGVAAVCSGDGGDRLVLEISRMIAGLYGIGANKVCVIF